MKKATSSSAASFIDQDPFQIALTKVLDEYCQRNAGKPVMTIEEIEKAGTYLLKKIDFKKTNDELSPEQRAYNAFFKFLYANLMQRSDESDSSINDAFYSDSLEDRMHYIYYISGKTMLMSLEDAMSRMHIDKDALLKCRRHLHFSNNEGNYGYSDIFDASFEDLEKIKSIESRASNMKEAFDKHTMLRHRLTIEEYATFLLSNALSSFLQFSKDIHDLNKEIINHFHDNKVTWDDNKIRPAFYLVFDTTINNSSIDLIFQYISRLLDNPDELDQLDYGEKMKSLCKLLFYYYLMREYCIIGEKLKANHDDIDIWRNIAALQFYSSNMNSSLVPIDEQMDFFHSMKSKRGQDKRWEPIKNVLQEAKRIAKKKWDEGDLALHDAMARWVCDKLKRNVDYKNVIENYDKRYPNKNASYNAILKELRKIAPPNRIFGMPGVKKDKD